MVDKAKELADDYLSTLSDLTSNSKPIINALTFVAKENVEHAQVIVNVIESHLRKVPPQVTLPVLYLLDSIVKNVGGQYRILFENDIVSLFRDVFYRVDENTRKSLHNLRQTWVDVFSCVRLRNLDNEVKKIDPAWPILGGSVPPMQPVSSMPSIHTSQSTPAATNVSAPSSANVPQASQEEIYARKQKELAELQKKKIQLLQHSSVEQAILKTVASQALASPPIVAEVKPVSRDPRLKTSSPAPVATPAVPDPRQLRPIPVIRTKDRQQQEQLALQAVQEQLKQLQQKQALLLQVATQASVPAPTPDVDISNVIPLAKDNEHTKTGFDNKDAPSHHLSDLSKEPKSLTSSAHASSPVKSPSKKQRRSKQPQQQQQQAKTDGDDAVTVSPSPPLTPSGKSKRKSLSSKKRDSSPSPPAKMSRSSSYRIPRRSSEAVVKAPTLSSAAIIEPSINPGLTEEEQSGSLIVSPPPPSHFKDIKSNAKGRNYMRRDKEESDTSPPTEESVQEADKKMDEDLRASLPGPSSEKKEDLDLRVVPSTKRPSLSDANVANLKKSKPEDFDTLFGNEDVDLRQLTKQFAGRPPTPPPPMISGSDSNDSWTKVKAPEKKERSGSEDRRDRERRDERKRSRLDRERSPSRGYGKNSDERDRSPSRSYGKNSDERDRSPLQDYSKMMDEPKDHRRWSHDDELRNNRRVREFDPFDRSYDNRRIENYESAMKYAIKQLEKGMITKMQYNQRIQDCISRRNMNGPGMRWQNQPRPQPWAQAPFGGPQGHCNDFRHMGPWQNPRYYGPMRPDFGVFHGPGSFNQNMGPNPRMGMMGPNGVPIMSHMMNNPPPPLGNPLVHMNNGPMNNANPVGPHAAAHMGGKFPPGHRNMMSEVNGDFVPDLHYNQSVSVLPLVPTNVHHADVRIRSPAPAVVTMPPAVPVLPVLDASEIYQKLVANGLIIVEDKKPEPKEPVEPSFDSPETLKGPISQKTLRKLYPEIPSSDSQLQFDADDKVEELCKHNNEGKEKDTPMRLFFPRVNDWCNDTVEEDHKSELFESEKENMEMEAEMDNFDAENSSSSVNEPSVKCTDGETVEKCEVCRDAFDSFYHNEKKEWHIRPAVESDDKYFHPDCFKNYVKEPEPEPEPAVQIEEKEEETDESPIEIVQEEPIEPSSEVPNEDDDIQIIDSPKEKKIVPEIVVSDTEEDDLHDQKSEAPQPPQNEDLPISEIKIKEEPLEEIDPDFFPMENDPDFERLISLAPIDTTHAELRSTIDGNVELDSTPIMQVKPTTIKINLTNPALLEGPKEKLPEKPKEKTPEPAEKAIEENKQLVPKSVKPRLQGRKLGVIPIISKGEQSTGLCTIM